MRILIYRTGSLGDTLIALPCFRAIRAKFPEAHICLLTNVPISNKAPRAIAVLAKTGLIDEVSEYTLQSQGLSGIFILVRILRKKKFDIVVHLAAGRTWGISLRDFVFFKLAGVKQVVGVPFSTKDLLHPKEIKEGLWEWEAERLARRIQPLVTVNLSHPSVWNLALTAEEEAEALSLLAHHKGRRWIAASVGTKADVKDWTENNWLALIKSLKTDFPEMGLVMIGCKADFDRSERCLAEWSGPKLNLCGRVSPRVSAAVLKETELFIGHDSGPMHLAAVVGTPCVAIFAARSFPGQWFPKGGARNQIFYHRTECFGCGLTVCTHHGKKCILSISAQEVHKAVKQSLALGARRPHPSQQSRTLPMTGDLVEELSSIKGLSAGA